MACVTCPYLENYELLWDDRAASGRFCVKLWCCAGPELQVRQGDEVVIDEYFEDVRALYERAAVLNPEQLASVAPIEPPGVHPGE
jgi:hypothetical protein